MKILPIVSGIIALLLMLLLSGAFYTVHETDTVILTQFQDNPRAVEVETLHRRVRELFDIPVHATGDPASAWHLARRLAGREDLVCVTGSFFIAAEIRELVVDQPQTEPTATR